MYYSVLDNRLDRVNSLVHTLL